MTETPSFHLIVFISISTYFPTGIYSLVELAEHVSFVSKFRWLNFAFALFP